MVKRGISGTSSSNSNSITKSSKKAGGFLLKTISLLGIGILGSCVFQYEQYPLYFYVLCVTLGFIIYTFSIMQISYLSQKAKLNSIVGVAALNSPSCTLYSVFSLFLALISVAGVTFRLSASFTVLLLKISGYSSSYPSIPIVFGIFYLPFILFVKRRDIVYSWARYSFAAILIAMSLFNLFTNFKTVKSSITNELSIPFVLSIEVFKEGLTVVGMTLLSLFCVTISDPDTLKAKKSIKNNEMPPSVGSLLLSNGVGLSINLFVIILLRNQILSIFLSDSEKISILFLLLILSVLIQSCEYLDRSHNLIFDFFKPLTDETLKSLKSLYFRQLLLIGLVFSISFFIGKDIEGSVNSMCYIVCLCLSIPFLVFPPIFMFLKHRKSDEKIEIFYWIPCLLTFSFGIILTFSNIFGLTSVQSGRIFKLMILSSRNLIILTITSISVYAVCLILDVFFYRPQTILPIGHRTIRTSESVVYGKNYMAEIIIILCFAATYIPSVRNFVDYYNDNIFLIAPNYFLKIFIHSDIVHIIMNSSCIYLWGRNISNEIGPFHFLAFFIVSGLIAKVGANILYIHTRTQFITGIGASGVIFALFAKKLFIEGIIYEFIFFPVSGHEFLFFTILICSVLVLTRLVDFISHEGHLSGFIFGIFFWSVSAKLWTLRERLHKTFLAKTEE